MYSLLWYRKIFKVYWTRFNNQKSSQARHTRLFGVGFRKQNYEVWRTTIVCTHRKEWHVPFEQVCGLNSIKDKGENICWQKLDCFVQKSSFCFLQICVVCLFARAERVCSRDNFAPKTGCLAWVQSSIVQLLNHCFASLSLHGILIDQGENDPLKIRQKKSLWKSTYSRTFSKIIIEQQLQWLPARVRYYRINIFKTVFKYSFLISFLNISFDISVCRRNSSHICFHLSAPFESVVKV